MSTHEKIVIADYGAGNLFSVENALKFIAKENPELSLSFERATAPAPLETADKIILPGVGAFPDAMKKLRESGLADALIESAKTKPFLGICVGMQALFEKGYEFEETKGLALIEGYVDKIEAPGLKIPHMGWSDVKVVNSSPLTETVKDGERFYFVHSYKAVTPEENICLLAEYGQKIPALVRGGEKGNIYGTQFHPEKSGPVGLALLKTFLSI